MYTALCIYRIKKLTFYRLHIQYEIVIDDIKPALLSQNTLPFFNFLVEKLYHLTRFHTDHVIVVIPPGHFKNRMPTLKIMPDDKACGLKLGQYTVNGRQTDIFTRLQQGLIDIFSTEMAASITGLFQQLKDFYAGQRHFQPGFTQLLILRRHAVSTFA